jgi:hypothetical protein
MSVPKHTIFASQALGLAAMFQALTSKHRLGGSPAYLPQLAAPDGPSTAGGKQALQHVSLIPEGGGDTIVIGNANTVEKRAELRSYRHVGHTYSQRWRGAQLPFDPDSYDELLKQIQAFFSSQSFTVTVLDLPAEREERGSGAARPRSRSLLLPGLLVAVALAGVAAYFFTS